MARGVDRRRHRVGSDRRQRRLRGLRWRRSRVGPFLARPAAAGGSSRRLVWSWSAWRTRASAPTCERWTRSWSRRAARWQRRSPVSPVSTALGFRPISASGADASGYLSQAAMWAQPATRVPDPLVTHPGAGPCTPGDTAPLGWKPALEPGWQVPTYAPGLPWLMAVPHAVAGHDRRGAARGRPSAGVAVWATARWRGAWAAAWRRSSPQRWSRPRRRSSVSRLSTDERCPGHRGVDPVLAAGRARRTRPRRPGGGHRGADPAEPCAAGCGAVGGVDAGRQWGAPVGKERFALRRRSRSPARPSPRCSGTGTVRRSPSGYGSAGDLFAWRTSDQTPACTRRGCGRRSRPSCSPLGLAVVCAGDGLRRGRAASPSAAACIGPENGAPPVIAGLVVFLDSASTLAYLRLCGLRGVVLSPLPASGDGGQRGADRNGDRAGFALRRGALGQASPPLSRRGRIGTRSAHRATPRRVPGGGRHRPRAGGGRSAGADSAAAGGAPGGRAERQHALRDRPARDALGKARSHSLRAALAVLAARGSRRGGCWTSSRRQAFAHGSLESRRPRSTGHRRSKAGPLMRTRAWRIRSGAEPPVP